MEGTNPEPEPDRERFITHVNYGLMQAWVLGNDRDNHRVRRRMVR